MARITGTFGGRFFSIMEVGTEAAETGDGGQDIFPFGKTVNPAFALRQGGEHQHTVSNRLIAGDGQFAGNAHRR